MTDVLNIISTGRCINDCVICCQGGELDLGLDHLTDEKSLSNLLAAFSEECLSVNGGDPLSNPDFLEMSILYHRNNKEIRINPLTFLSIETGRAAPRIHEADFLKTVRDARVHGLSPESEQLIGMLAQYTIVDVSAGDLQAPSTQIAQWSRSFFDHFIVPRMREYGNPKIGYVTHSGMVLDDYLLCDTELLCVGRLREMFEQGHMQGGRLTDLMYAKQVPCAPPDVSIVNFSDDTLRLQSCCSAGMNPFISFYDTQITSSDIASMRQSKVRSAVFKAHQDLIGSGMYQLLNTPFALDCGQPDERQSLHFQFNTLISWTNDLLREKDQKIVNRSYTIPKSGQPDTTHFCEVCNSLALGLQRAKITPSDYQSYIEDRFSYAKR